MIKLICVTPDNHNKFYYMEDLNNGTFKVTYGRVGNSERIVNYPISQWNTKYNEKIKKGYIDVTEKISAVKKSNELDIKDTDVKELIDFLMKSAKASIKRDYSISAEAVTQTQLDEAQSIIDNIYQNKDVFSLKGINDELRQLYTIIPRKMADTRSFFLNSLNIPYLIELLQSEQSKLDTLKTQVNVENISEDKITLESLGFSCEVASKADKEFIKNNTDFRLTNHKVFKITNHVTENIFNPKHLKTKLLYHGSRNENFLSIIQNGLKIRPKGVQTTGSMFGSGIYFADRCIKALGYTSLKNSYWARGNDSTAYIALFEVALGKQYNIFESNKHWSSWMGNLTEEKINELGFNSTFAKGGIDLKNNEYIIYNPCQCTIKYLIEMKSNK